MGIAHNYKHIGWLESLTFARPLTLAAGATYPAGIPVLIEPFMRRTALLPAPQTLTVKRALQKTASYANADVAKEKISTLFRGSVPTTVENLFWITHFTITSFPLLTTDSIVHVLNRMDAGTKPSRHPKYPHLFVYSNATEKTPAFGFFMTTNPPLHGLDFARFLFVIDGAMHSASNVPMLGRVTKSRSALGNVKPKREK